MILYNIEKFKNHPSIKRIKDVTNLDGTFTFNFITLDNMVNKMNHLDLTKSNPLTSIPTKKTTQALCASTSGLWGCNIS